METKSKLTPCPDLRFQEMSPIATEEEEEDRTLKAQISTSDKGTQARLVLAGHRLTLVYPIPQSGLSGASESRDVVLFDPQSEPFN